MTRVDKAGDSQNILDEIIAAGAWEGPRPETDDSVEVLRYAAATAMSLKYNCEAQISVNELRRAADEIERLRANQRHVCRRGAPPTDVPPFCSRCGGAV